MINKNKSKEKGMKITIKETFAGYNIKEIQNSIKADGYTTWPKLRRKLKVSYAGVIRILDYMVEKKLLLPPDENGRYFLNKNRDLLATLKHK